MVEYKKHKDGDFWRLRDGFWTRDHPKWREKHPLGPVSFDMMCHECDFMIEDTFDSCPKELKDHWIKNHAFPRFVVELGFVVGDGAGI